MKKLSLFVTVAVTLVISSGIVFASDYEKGEREYRYDRSHDDKDRRYYGRLDVAPVENEFYKEECGSCHLAFQPGLLPARSWDKLMANLENHFDESAEMDAKDQEVLTRYLKDNAADRSDYKKSRSINRSVPRNEAPLRISETGYFIHEHDEIPRRLVQGNPDVKSFSKCEACHQSAEQGSYDEDQIRIPGYGRWDD